MYVGFSRFLIALCVIGVGFGAAFGAGVLVGKGQGAATVASAAPATPGAAAAAGRGAGGGQGGGGAAGGGAGGGAGAQALNGVIDSVTPTSIIVRQASGTAVTIAVNEQTAIRRNDSGTIQDLRAGTQVIVQPDAAMVATSVQIVPAGGAGAGGRPGANAAAATATATPGGNRGAGGTPAAGR